MVIVNKTSYKIQSLNTIENVNIRMYECKLPYFNYVKLSKEDFVFMILAVFLVFIAIISLIYMNTITGITVALVQLVLSFIVMFISIYNGKLRVQREEYVNPIKQIEAYQNHAIAEGI